MRSGIENLKFQKILCPSLSRSLDFIHSKVQKLAYIASGVTKNARYDTWLVAQLRPALPGFLFGL
jgi:hypothetical protein